VYPWEANPDRLEAGTPKALGNESHKWHPRVFSGSLIANSVILDDYEYRKYSSLPLFATQRSLVKTNDILYFLGDFCIAPKARSAELRREIRCKKIFAVPGNHDKDTRKLEALKLF
jgi:hypothetical protein